MLGAASFREPSVSRRRRSFSRYPHVPRAATSAATLAGATVVGGGNVTWRGQQRCSNSQKADKHPVMPAAGTAIPADSLLLAEDVASPAS